MALELLLTCADGVALPIEAAAVEAAADAVLAEAGVDDAVVELGIRLVDESESADLNGRYRNNPYATNVLSFPAGADLPRLRVLGDLVICMPVVAREAEVQHKPLAAHFTHMIVHGVLHLLGFDHLRDDEAEVMEAAERRVMTVLGYDDPYRVRVAG